MTSHCNAQRIFTPPRQCLHPLPAAVVVETLDALATVAAVVRRVRALTPDRTASLSRWVRPAYITPQPRNDNIKDYERRQHYCELYNDDRRKQNKETMSANVRDDEEGC